MPLSGHQQIPMAQILYHPSMYLAFSRSLASSNEYTTQLRMCSLGDKEVGVKGSGRKTLCLVQCLAMQC